ncbi:MAG: hypothetical protein ACRDRH_20280 [Pseudonocardia sp.]
MSAARDIAELLAWCQHLSVAGPDADPAERAAYPGAETDLLAHITVAATAAAPREEQR